MTYATTWPLLSSPSPAAPGHVDPSTIPLEQLARIRGAMWTAKLGGLAYGPRPFADDNILAIEFLYLYSPSDQQRMIAAWKQRGYTHACIGPCNGQGYHTDYPDRSFVDNFDAYLDVFQQLWDAGIAPVFFAKGDYWSTQDLIAHEHLFTSERAQRLIRIVVPGGWEPHRETPSTTWREWLEWGARVFPRALRVLHMVADHDAPGSSSEGIDNADLWNNVAHLIHLWFVQSFAFADPTALANDGKRTVAQEWLDSYDPRVSGSYPDRFCHGYAGWPTHSAWGPGKPIRDVPAEFASFWVYNNNRPEAEAQAWGDAAIAVGARGYMDGGTVPVP